MAILKSTLAAVVYSLVVAAGSCAAAGLADQPIDEYRVKAAFLYNFAKFVQWPAGSFRSASEPLAICILGQDPFGTALEDTVADHSIEGHPVVIRRVSGVKQASGCHILFVSSVENRRSPSELGEARTQGTLTVGESDPPPEGVVIDFRIEDGKVRFDINVDAAERQKLRISSRLLSLAHVVESPRK